MLTREEVRKVIEATLTQHGLGICGVLNNSELLSAGNLVALMEIFADKLEAEKSPDTVAVIDAKMGVGWTRKLADNLR